MFKHMKIVSLLLMAGVITACDQSSINHEALVVDVTAVARALGRDQVMQQQLESARQQLAGQLVQISTDLTRQLQEKQQELTENGKKQDEKTSHQLGELELQANQQLNKSRQLAGQKATEFRNKLVIEFRSEVVSVAAEIAKQKGAAYVYASNSLLWHTSSVDITDEVIGAMRAMASNRQSSSEVDSQANSQQGHGGVPATANKAEQAE